MTHKLLDLVKVQKSQIHGKGLFAKQDIAKGTIIGKVAGHTCSTDGPHVLWFNDQQQAFKVTNEMKYINHNKQANVAYYDDLTVVALKNIKAENELFHDYGDEWD